MGVYKSFDLFQLVLFDRQFLDYLEYEVFERFVQNFIEAFEQRQIETALFDQVLPNIDFLKIYPILAVYYPSELIQLLFYQIRIDVEIEETIGVINTLSTVKFLQIQRP